MIGCNKLKFGGILLLSPHAGLKKNFEVAHARRIGQGKYPLAQIIPPQEGHLTAVGGSFSVRFREFVRAAILQAFINAQTFQPRTLGGECAQSETMETSLMNQCTKSDMSGDACLTGDHMW